jgi:UDP-2-acetamido-3-amino-2,3-dideoxy-glucuronate N-acetyltransferase
MSCSEESVVTDYFVHPNGICESEQVGAGSRIWAFAHVLPGAIIGADCNICDHVFIENDVIVGDRVTVKCGVQLWDGVRLANDVFVGPNVSFTNDPLPRSKVYPEKFLETHIGPGASIGANATILPGLSVGRSAAIGAGAVVTKNVPAHAIVVGNPARITGYVGVPARGHTANARPVTPQDVIVPGVELLTITRADDLRGSLVAVEFGGDLPFVPQRAFVVFGVPTREVRGEHAHRSCEQVLICLNGRVSCIADDGEHRQEFSLDRPDIGLYIPALVWATQFDYSSDAVLIVLASRAYDANDYIRDYEDFLAVKFPDTAGWDSR